MSVYVMSDIHGEADLFHAMLKQIRFSQKDTLYILGDVIDRGPDGIALLQEIMRTPNMVMLLGNHEAMMLRCCHKNVTALDCLRWSRNGNQSTVAAFRRLESREKRAMIEYLSALQTHVQIMVGEIPYYLVHGFPSDNPEDELWKRPELNERNPVAEARLIIGHTPVLNLVVPREERGRYIQMLEREKEHPQILFARGFIDIDCGCSYGDAMKTLGCLRLDDLTEFYEVKKTHNMQQIRKDAV